MSNKEQQIKNEAKVTAPPPYGGGGWGGEALFDEQLSSWEMAKNNYDALKQVKEKEVVVNGCRYKVQFNPARIVSSAAKVDAKSIQVRKCFLCLANLPSAQRGIAINGHYLILVNPFPIFPRHLTVPDLEHVDQRILLRFGDMLDLAAKVDDYVVFYNGPKCGASAPDHAHFQAGNKGFLPIETEWQQKKNEKVAELPGGTLWALDDYPRATLAIEATDKADAMTLFGIVYGAMELKPGEEEPMMNLLAWVEAGKWMVLVFPREQHRPSCYAAEGEANILISPASVDMGGVFITPLEKDFEKITAENIAAILSEVCLSPVEFRKLIQRIKEQL